MKNYMDAVRAAGIGRTPQLCQDALIETLDRYAAMDTAALLKQRYQKFRCIGGQL